MIGDLFRWLTDAWKAIQPWATVLPWERGVRVTLGRYTRLLEPGIRWRIPLVHTVWIVNTRLRFTSFPPLTLTTADGKQLTVAGIIGFRITDPLAAMQSMTQIEVSCPAMVQAAISESVGEKDLEDLVREELEEEAINALRLATNGLTFEMVRITDFGAIRTLRLIQESWRPETERDKEPGE